MTRKNNSSKKKTIISMEQVQHTARLSNINIIQNEQNKYSKELTEIINYNIDHLDKINTNKIEPTAHATGEKSIVRNDNAEPGLSTEKALQNVPEKYNFLFKVKHIFGEK